MASEVLCGFVLEKPFVLVVRAVKQLVHLVLLPFNLIVDVFARFQLEGLRLLRAQIHLEKLFGLRLHAQEVRLFDGGFALVNRSVLFFVHYLARLRWVVICNLAPKSKKDTYFLG